MPTKIILRPDLNLSSSDNISPAEDFQNQTLRPILKLQNDLFTAYFKDYVQSHKKDFESLSAEKKSQLITQSLQNDLVLKNTFIGMTVGMFTDEEMQTFLADRKVFSKRIVTMLIERLRSQLAVK